MDLDTPLESPAWWTLDDSVSPEQLRTIFRDRENHEARYRAAQEARGLAVENGITGRVKFYLDGSRNPEFVPMWLALLSFSRSLDYVPEDAVAQSLGEYGLGPGAVEQIVDVAKFNLEKQRELTNKVAPEAMAFVEMMRKVLGHESPVVPQKAPPPQLISRSRLDELLEQEDFRQLADLMDVTEAQVESMYAAWRVNPPLETGVEFLPVLRERLTTEEWTSFRLYLLEQIAPQIKGGPDLSER